jgi:lipopolysaccharide/colanic/teichoic acid biosynthesis glycosyltransferase
VLKFRRVGNRRTSEKDIIANRSGAKVPTSYELSSPEESAAGVSQREIVMYPQSRAFAQAIKRLVDIVGSAGMLIVAAPLFPVITLAIRLDSPGPTFFRPKVIGHKGRKFSAYKFRSMYADAFERLHQDTHLLSQYKKNLKIIDDPRITRVGRYLRRTSLDELPQLINVLRGEMSLVGPRFLAELELEKFGEHRDKILSVKPGMAGLWVASGRQTVSFERRLELELQYIDNWSLWLDVKCFLKTLQIAIRMVGAH